MKALLKEYNLTMEQVENYCDSKKQRASVTRRVKKFILAINKEGSK